MGTRAVSVAYTLQPDPPPWTLPEQGISRGGSPFTRARHCWGRHIGMKQFPKIFKVFGHKNMGTRAVSVAYTLQPDPPPWTLPEQGISRGWEPIHKGQALLG